jgi:hypothetical protein
MATTNSLVRPVSDPNAYALCHAMGHSWRHHDPVRDVNSTLLIQISNCTDCTCRRTRFITRRGLIADKPRYEYPDGYLHKKTKDNDEPARSIQEWRLTFVTKLFGDEEDTQPKAARAARKRAS